MQYSTLIRKKDKGYQYVITYKVNGTWKTKSKQGFKKSNEAKSAMNIALEELKELLKNNIDKSSLDKTFKYFTDMYIEHLTIYRETNSVLAFKTAINNFEPLNNKELIKITNLDIQKCVDRLVKRGLRPTTIKDYLSKLKTILRAARDEYKMIITLPTYGVKVAENKYKINKRALNIQEVDKLLDDFRNSKYYLVILIAVKCGLRLGEILGLTWKDIDLKNSVIKVNKQWKQTSTNTYGFGTLKSKNSNRLVPISSKLKEELKNDENVVNINSKLFNFKNTDSVSICINRLLKKKGYDITIHELRHTYATMLISNGVDFKTAAQFLGHTVEQTMKTYSHVNDDMVKRATNIIENIF